MPIPHPASSHEVAMIDRDPNPFCRDLQKAREAGPGGRRTTCWQDALGGKIERSFLMHEVHSGADVTLAEPKELLAAG